MQIATAVIFIAWFFLFLKVYHDNKRKTQYTNGTKFIVRVAIFGAISAILYTVPGLKFSLPFFPSFLEIHFDEVPVFIAGFAYGPLSAFCVLLIKTVIKLPFSSTLCVGEFSDLVFSSAFILPAAFIYKKRRNLSGAIYGLLAGTLIQLVISLVGNIYVMIPFYMFVYNMSAEQLLYICQLANPSIKDIGWTYGLFAVLPFNLIKDVIVVIVTFLVYKSTHRFIDKLQS